MVISSLKETRKQVFAEFERKLLTQPYQKMTRPTYNLMFEGLKYAMKASIQYSFLRLSRLTD